MSGGPRRSRRELFTAWGSMLRDVGRAAHETSVVDPRAALYPPGALKPEEAFFQACTGCGDCVTACPPGAIITIDREDGRALPVIDPARKPCVLCDALPCVTACPDGALVDPGGPERVRMGIARVDPRRCTTFKVSSCRLCYRACPYPDRAILMIGGRPLVSSAACTGCGLCEFACPEHPKAITVTPERDLVPGLRVPRTEYER